MALGQHHRGGERALFVWSHDPMVVGFGEKRFRSGFLSLPVLSGRWWILVDSDVHSLDDQFLAYG